LFCPMTAPGVVTALRRSSFFGENDPWSVSQSQLHHDLSASGHRFSVSALPFHRTSFLMQYLCATISMSPQHSAYTAGAPRSTLVAHGATLLLRENTKHGFRRDAGCLLAPAGPKRASSGTPGIIPPWWDVMGSAKAGPLSTTDSFSQLSVSTRAENRWTWTPWLFRDEPLFPQPQPDHARLFS